MPLSQETARSYLPTLEWLFDDEQRRSGRTTLLAIAFIRLACKHPGRRMYFQDHAPTVSAANNMREVVLGLISDDSLLKGSLSLIRKDSFILDLPKPIDDWVPMDWRTHSGLTRWDLIK